MPRLSLLDLLLKRWPDRTHEWMHWANRFRWLDASGEWRRLRQHARARRYGQQANQTFHNEACDPGRTLDVEVLITAYRYRDVLPDAVHSATQAIAALQARGGDGGIVAVEDCGADGSWHLLCRLARASSVPMRVLQPARNIGLTAARNLALFSSRSRSVFVLDADNQVYPSALARLYERLRQERAVAAYGPLDVVTPSGESKGRLSDQPPNRTELLTSRNHIDAMALFDTTELQRIGGWDPDMLRHCWGFDDYELWVRLVLADASIAFDPEPVGRYLSKPDSMSRRLNPRTEKRFRAYMRAKHGPACQLD